MSELDKLNKDVKALQNELKALSKQVVIVGTIVPYGGESEPGDGWLLCDGRPLPREDYKDLYLVIGANFGAPNETHFNLPDLRGRFVRGVDHGQGRDPDAGDREKSAEHGNIGDKVGSVQDDAVGEHTHKYETNIWYWKEKQEGKTYLRGDHMTDSRHFGETKINEGKETRPKNVYVNWIIYAGV